MTTLLRSGGRMCTARCYDSAHDATRCKCICGGRLHGTHGQATTQLETAVRAAEIAPALVVDEFAHLFDAPLPGMETLK